MATTTFKYASPDQIASLKAGALAQFKSLYDSSTSEDKKFVDNSMGKYFTNGNLVNFSGLGSDLQSLSNDELGQYIAYTYNVINNGVANSNTDKMAFAILIYSLYSMEEEAQKRGLTEPAIQSYFAVANFKEALNDFVDQNFGNMHYLASSQKILAKNTTNKGMMFAIIGLIIGGFAGFFGAKKAGKNATYGAVIGAIVLGLIGYLIGKRFITTAK